MRKDIKESGWIEKNWKIEKKIFLNFGPGGPPSRGPHISAQEENFKNPSYSSLPTTHRVIHAKLDGIRSINLKEMDTGFDFHPGQFKKRGNL